MDFLHHTINWVKGEIFEAMLFGGFGFLTITCSFLFWIFGTTLNSKAVIVPFALVGIFFLFTAISGILTNNKRVREYTNAYQLNNLEFVLSEKKRVEDFQYLYKMTLVIASVSFAVALSFFYFSNNYLLKAAGLALILFGMAGLVIDYFSKERADTYYEKILMELASNSIS
jgi:O-antigen/teichoic acid export membrane protein